MPLIYLDSRNLTRRRERTGSLLWTLLLSFLLVCGLAACGDVSTAPTAPKGPGALTITTTTLPNGTVNQPYATTVGASGGITPYTWSVTPALPANLSFDQTTGAITGIQLAELNRTVWTRGIQNRFQSGHLLGLVANWAALTVDDHSAALPPGFYDEAFRTEFILELFVGHLPTKLLLNLLHDLLVGRDGHNSGDDSLGLAGTLFGLDARARGEKTNERNPMQDDHLEYTLLPPRLRGGGTLQLEVGDGFRFRAHVASLPAAAYHARMLMGGRPLVGDTHDAYTSRPRSSIGWHVSPVAKVLST